MSHSTADLHTSLLAHATAAVASFRRDTDQNHDWFDSFFDRLANPAATTLVDQLKTPRRKPLTSIFSAAASPSAAGATLLFPSASRPAAAAKENHHHHASSHTVAPPRSPAAAASPRPGVVLSPIRAVVGSPQKATLVPNPAKAPVIDEVEMEVPPPPSELSSQDDEAGQDVEMPLEEHEKTANLSIIGEEEEDDEPAPIVVDMDDEVVVQHPDPIRDEAPLGMELDAPGPTAPREEIAVAVAIEPSAPAQAREPAAEHVAPAAVERLPSPTVKHQPSPVVEPIIERPPSPVITLPTPPLPSTQTLASSVSLIVSETQLSVPSAPASPSPPHPEADETSVPLNDAPSTLRDRTFSLSSSLQASQSASKPASRTQLTFVGLPKKSLPFALRPSTSFVVGDSQPQSQGSSQPSTTTTTTTTTPAAGQPRASNAADDAGRERRLALAHRLQSMGVKHAGRASAIAASTSHPAPPPPPSTATRTLSPPSFTSTHFQPRPLSPPPPSTSSRALSPPPLPLPPSKSLATLPPHPGPEIVRRTSVRDAVRNFERGVSPPKFRPTTATVGTARSPIKAWVGSHHPPVVFGPPVPQQTVVERKEEVVMVQQMRTVVERLEGVRATPTRVPTPISTTPVDSPPRPPVVARAPREVEESRSIHQQLEVAPPPPPAAVVEAMDDNDTGEEEDERNEIRIVGDMLGLGEESLRFGDEDSDVDASFSSDDAGARLPSLPPPIHAGDDHNDEADADDESDDSDPTAPIVVEKGRGEFVMDVDNALRTTIKPSTSATARLASVAAMPGAFGDDDVVDDEEDDGEDTRSRPLSKQSSNASLASSATASSTVAGGSVLGFLKFGGAAGKRPEAKGQVKSIQLAAAAAKKEKEDKERRAAQKEEREQKRLAALTKRQEEERQRLDEERRTQEKKRKDRDDAAAASQSGKPTKVVRTLGKPSKTDRGPEDEPGKKRKVEGDPKLAPVVKKAPQVSRPFTTSASGLQSSLNSSVGRMLSNSTATTAGGLNKSASSALTKSTTTSAANPLKTTSNVVGGGAKYMAAPPQPPRVATLNPASSQSKVYAPSGQAQASTSRPRPPSPKAEPEQLIVLPDIDSEYSDSSDEGHEEKIKQYPHWAKSPSTALIRQASTNPDDVFGPIPPLSMKEIFKTNHGRFSKRSSSARWEGSDALTETEKAQYSRTMGYVQMTFQSK